MLRPRNYSTPVKYSISIGSVATAAFLQWLVWDKINPAPYLLFYPAVIFGALNGDGRFSTFLSALVAQYLFVPPMYSLYMIWPADYIRVVLFILSGLMISSITKRLRNALLMAEKLAKDESSARQAAEKAIQELHVEQELRERFVATLTHDIRSPLSAAQTSAQMMQRYPEKTEQRERLTTRIVDSIGRANDMLQDLLDVSRIKAGQRLPFAIEHCELRSLTENALEELKVVHGDRFILKCQDHISGYWNCEGLRRAIENLANNAIKYGASNAPVTMRLRTIADKVEVAVHNEIDGDGKILTEQEMATLWEPFRRLEAAEASGMRGWGIGLTLVKGIAEAHGGAVAVESSLAEGTTFKLILPKDARAYQGHAEFGIHS